MTSLNWRNLRSPITLLVLIIVLVFAAQWGWKNVVAPVPEPPPPSCVPQQASTLESSQVSVRVFNGSTRRGLAGEVADSLDQLGFNVVEVGNVEQNVSNTIVVGAHENNPEVRLVAQTIRKVTTRGDGRTDGTVDVLVGSEFANMNPEPVSSIEVPGDSVCLPPPSTEPATTG